MWEISLEGELSGLAASVPFGMLLCFIYGFFGARNLQNGTGAVSVFVRDIAFSLISAVLTFTFLLAVSNGEMRAYLFFGMSAGFFVFRLTLYKAEIKALCFFIRLSRELSRRFSRFLRRINTHLSRFLKNIAASTKKILKKISKLGKNS